MRLPNAAQAFVPRKKLTGYLLSETHAVGKEKAKFFRALGFAEGTLVELEQGLLSIGRSGEVVETIASMHGVKYVVDGWLQTPRGETVRLRTVWIVEKGQKAPRLVTAYPTDAGGEKA